MVKTVLGILIILTVYFAVVFFKDYAKAVKEDTMKRQIF